MKKKRDPPPSALPFLFPLFLNSAAHSTTSLSPSTNPLLSFLSIFLTFLSLSFSPSLRSRGWRTRRARKTGRREDGKTGRQMDDKENCLRITRGVAKRTAATAASCDGGAGAGGEPPSAKRKRVALGELPTLSNAMVSASSSTNEAYSKLRSRSKKGVRAAESTDTCAKEMNDLQVCPQYASDIYSYLRSMEVEATRRPLVGYIERIQNDVNTNMRGILVDWLVEVAEEYKMVSDTLFLTVSYIDRYLSFKDISRLQLQLLGVSAMLIASKYEEIHPPHVEEFCYITDNTYTKKQVLEMESDILRFLKFEIGNPTIKTFLRRFTKASQEDGDYPTLLLEFTGCYLAELSLLDYETVQFLPSIVAASAVFLARFNINQENPPWTKRLQQYTGYKVSELQHCIHLIHDLQLKKRGSNLEAVRDKYKQHRFKCVSSLNPPAVIPDSFLEDITVQFF